MLRQLYQISIVLFVSLFACHLHAQEKDTTIVQFSGKVVYEEEGDLKPAQYANIYVKGTTRGTTADYEGFYTLVARKGEMIVFSSIGFKNAEYLIPPDLKGDRYSLFQILTKDTISLPEVFIYPWPSRQHFDIEFAEMDVTEELLEIAQENLAKEKLEEAMLGLASDGDEYADLYFREQAQKYYTAGQLPAANIFNLVAWQKFFKAWKEGDFKKKKKVK